MGTRATIKIEDVTFAKVYKHFDGYPEATLPWLESFNKRFYEDRGDDPAYKFAQLLRSSVRDQVEYNLDASKETGWGVVEYDDTCGAEYEYILKTDGSVTYAKI